MHTKVNVKDIVAEGIAEGIISPSSLLDEKNFIPKKKKSKKRKKKSK